MYQVPFVNWMTNKIKDKNWNGVSIQVFFLEISMFIEFKQVIDLGGGFLLIKYISLSELLSNVYPNVTNDASQESIWTDEKHAKYFAEWLKKQSVEEIDYVYRMVINREEGVNNDVLTKHLSQNFPKYNWVSRNKFSKKSQYLLKECLEQLFQVEGNFFLRVKKGKII